MWRYRELLPVARRTGALPGADRRHAAAARAGAADGARTCRACGSRTRRAARPRPTRTAPPHSSSRTGCGAGSDTITTASTGNAAVSTAFGAAAAGLRAVIFVSTDCQPDKLALMTQAGAWVFQVPDGLRGRRRPLPGRRPHVRLAGPQHRRQPGHHRGEEDGGLRGVGAARPADARTSWSPRSATAPRWWRSTRASPSSSAAASPRGGRAWSACRPSAASRWCGPGSGSRRAGGARSRRHGRRRHRGRCARPSATPCSTRCAAAAAAWSRSPTTRCCGAVATLAARAGVGAEPAGAAALAGLDGAVEQRPGRPVGDRRAAGHRPGGQGRARPRPTRAAWRSPRRSTRSSGPWRGIADRQPAVSSCSADRS